MQVPQWYVDQHCSHIADHDRQVKCGMIAAMDEGVKNVTEALRQRGLLDNTFIVFTSDNGGPVHAASSNWPLRGSKTTIWEGGTRAAAFVYGPQFLRPWGNGNGSSSSSSTGSITGRTYEELIHLVDWYPTLIEAAGGNASAIANIDGVSQWRNLLSGGPGPRTEFLYNLDEVSGSSGLRQGRYKLLHGYPGSPNGWFPPAELVNETEVKIHGGHSHTPEYQLFDLQLDPEEKHDVSHSRQDVLRRMQARLQEYRTSLVPSGNADPVHAASPHHFNGNWSPGWC